MDFRGFWETVTPDVVRQRYAAKLLVALLAAVVLTVGFGALVQADTSSQLRTDANEELTTTAAMRAESLDIWLGSVEEQTRLTSAHPAVASGNRSRARAHLSGLVESGNVPDGVIAVHYYDTESKRLVASSNPRMEGINASEKGAPFARDPPSFSGPEDTYVTEPFSVPVVNHPVLAVVSPVPGVEDRAVVYMINLRQRVRSLADTAKGTLTVVDGSGRIVAHSNTSRIGEPAGAGTGGADPDDGNVSFSDSGDSLTASAPLETTDWTVNAHLRKSAAYALGDRVTSGILGLILLLTITLALVGVTIGTGTVSSLRRIADRAQRMADGDLDVSLAVRREDEFATLSRTFIEMRDSLRESLSEAESARETAERSRKEAERTRAAAEEQADRLARTASEYEAVMRDVADGDLTRRVDADVEDEAMRAVGESFNEMVAEIERTLVDVKRFSEHVTASVDETGENVEAVQEASGTVARSVEEIAQGATDQTESFHEVEAEMGGLSASAEEIAATVDDLAETSREAARAGADGRETAERALTEMDAVREGTARTSEEIEALQEEVAEIGEIAEVITEIADRTNLLALNASIEAARAGDGSGETDGFAVVADEVKSLAEETKASVEEVEARIETIQERTSQTVERMHETGERVEAGTETVEGAIDALERIVGRVEEIDGGITEIVDATEEQARAAEVVVDMVEEVAAISEETAAQAEAVDGATDRQTAALEDVSSAAGDLAGRAERLRSVLESFTVDATAHEEGVGGEPAPDPAGGTTGTGAMTDD